MVDFNVIYTGVQEKIGLPVDYETFSRKGFKNRQGKVTIPKHIIFQQTSDSDIEDELDFSKLPYLMDPMDENIMQSENNTHVSDTNADIAENEQILEENAEFIRRVQTRSLTLKHEYVKINVLTKFSKSW
jgi:hypothetical protein